MNRKTFLKNSLGTAGLLYHPLSVFTEYPVIGHGNKRYQLDKEWSKAMVANHPVNDCHEMVQDSQGRIILLTNETKNNVLIYNKSGRLLTSWGSEYPGAHGLTLHKEGGTDVLFICDNKRHQVIKTTLEGRVLLTLDYPKETEQYSSKEEYVPTETAIAPNGDIYVADGYGKDFIIQYDPKGRYLRYFGGRGTGPEHLLNAHGICVDLRNPQLPCLIVTSRQQRAFKRFTLAGEYIDTIELPGAWVCRPVIRGDFLYSAVLQSHTQQWKQSGFITILDKDFKVISNPGGTEPQYTDGRLGEMAQGVKHFQYPHDVCVDDEENIYVAQWNSGKVYPYKLTPIK